MTADGAITIAICSDGRSPHLTDAVRAALSQRQLAAVLVIDNDPMSGEVKRMLAGLAGPAGGRLRIVDEAHRGLSRARNAALRCVETPLIAYTDDDALADPAWIDQLIAVFSADAEMKVACVTGRVTADRLETDAHRWFEEGFGFDKGDRSMVWGSAADVGPPNLLRGMTASEHGLVYPYAGGEFGSGNNMAFRTHWLRSRGGFDVALGAGTPSRGGEDLDAFRAVVLSGLWLVYNPEALVTHRHRDTLDLLARQAFGYGSGMAASITVLCCREPRHLLRVIRRLPAAAGLLLRRGSIKNAAKSADYPRRLDRAELLGYLFGPALAAAGIVQRRRSRRV